jgi:hypothetical protein
MKKVIRLTESDLVKLIKRVINEEQSSTLPSSVKSLSNFLKGFDCGNISNKFPHWKPNPNNEFYASSMKVNVKEVGDVTRDTRCWDYNKPLQWSVFVNGTPDEFASIRFTKTQSGIFFFYKDKYGKRGQLDISGNESQALKITNSILSSFNDV